MGFAAALNSLSRRQMGRLATSALCAFIATVFAGCATNPVTGEQNLVLVSERQELALGQQAHQQTLQQYRVYEDAALQQYVDAVGQRLAAVSHRDDLNFTFTLLDSAEINAFALPGGYIYITRGLLAYLNSEAELAAVLGHEIGHVTARHGVRQASSAQATNLGAGLLSIFLPGLRSAGMQQSLGLLSTAVLRGYGREHELEADRLGVEYLSASGYDRHAMFRVVRTLKNHQLLDNRIAAAEGREVRAYHGVFSTHPDHDTRLKSVVGYDGSSDHDGTEERRRFLDQIDGLIFGMNPAEGLFLDDRFVHRDLGFSLRMPADWRGQNLSDQVVMTDPGQQAILMLRLAPHEGQALDVALRRFGVGALSRREALTINGLPALAGLAQVSVQGQQRPARIIGVQLGQYVYAFLGVTRDADALGGFDAQFRRAALSFRALTPDERASIPTRKVKVTRLKSAISWATLGQASPLKLFAADHLKVLNASTTADAATGTRIKIIE